LPITIRNSLVFVAAGHTNWAHVAAQVIHHVSFCQPVRLTWSASCTSQKFLACETATWQGLTGRPTAAGRVIAGSGVCCGRLGRLPRLTGSGLESGEPWGDCLKGVVSAHTSWFLEQCIGQPRMFFQCSHEFVQTLRLISTIFTSYWCDASPVSPQAPCHLSERKQGVMAVRSA
jgi:hypothetical protein